MPLNIGGYDPLKKGGLAAPGKAQFIVVDIEEKEEYYNATLEIVAHEVPGNVGKKSYNNFSTSGKGAARLQYFLEATKVISRDDIKAAVESGETEVDFDIQDAVGRTFFGLLESGSYEKDGKTKQTCKVEWTFLAPDDPETKDYPRDTELAPPIVGTESTDQSVNHGSLRDRVIEKLQSSTYDGIIKKNDDANPFK